MHRCDRGERIAALGRAEGWRLLRLVLPFRAGPWAASTLGMAEVGCCAMRYWRAVGMETAACLMPADCNGRGQYDCHTKLSAYSLMFLVQIFLQIARCLPAAGTVWVLLALRALKLLECWREQVGQSAIKRLCTT